MMCRRSTCPYKLFAVICVDETGFPKKGTKSVGVKRQYSGILGRVDNCQIAVFLNYVSKAEHVFLDRSVKGGQKA